MVSKIEAKFRTLWSRKNEGRDGEMSRYFWVVVSMTEALVFDGPPLRRLDDWRFGEK